VCRNKRACTFFSPDRKSPFLFSFLVIETEFFSPSPRRSVKEIALLFFPFLPLEQRGRSLREVEMSRPSRLFLCTYTRKGSAPLPFLFFSVTFPKKYRDLTTLRFRISVLEDETESAEDMSLFFHPPPA